MRTTRLMTLFGLTMYCLTCTAIAQLKNSGQQPGATQPATKSSDMPTEDPFGKSDDPFSGTPQGENPFGDGGGAVDVQSKPMQISIDGKTFKPTRIFHFQVNIDSLTIVGDSQPVSWRMATGSGAGGMMGSGGGYGMEGGMGGAYGGMGAEGMGDMGGMSGMASGGMGMGMPGGMAGPNRSVVHVSAYVFDDEKREGRTRIEVVTDTRGKKGGVVGHPLEKLQLPQGKAKPKMAFTPASAKLVEDAIRLKIWKMDSIREFKANGGKGDLAAEAEQLLKAILTEEYEGQIKRQEFELARLKSQLEKIQDEITRRQVAKDRVIDVQLGKILLEAQGIIGQGEQ